MFDKRICRVTMNHRTVEAEAAGSDNLKSLMLTFDRALYTRSGGMYPGRMAVLMDDHGTAAECPIKRGQVLERAFGKLVAVGTMHHIIEGILPGDRHDLFPVRDDRLTQE